VIHVVSLGWSYRLIFSWCFVFRLPDIPPTTDVRYQQKLQVSKLRGKPRQWRSIVSTWHQFCRRQHFELTLDYFGQEESKRSLGYHVWCQFVRVFSRVFFRESPQELIRKNPQGWDYIAWQRVSRRDFVVDEREISRLLLLHKESFLASSFIVWCSLYLYCRHFRCCMKLFSDCSQHETIYRLSSQDEGIIYSSWWSLGETKSLNEQTFLLYWKGSCLIILFASCAWRIDPNAFIWEDRIELFLM
jgi:hypothetical protein